MGDTTTHLRQPTDRRRRGGRHELATVLVAHVELIVRVALVSVPKEVHPGTVARTRVFLLGGRRLVVAPRHERISVQVCHEFIRLFAPRLTAREVDGMQNRDLAP